MLLDLARNWWVFLLDGACAILFGILTFAWPAVTLVVLAFLYGIYAIAHGVLALSASRCKHDTGRSWRRMAPVGVISILSGILAMAWPGATALVLLYIVAAWAVVRGIFEIVAAIELRRVLHD